MRRAALVLFFGLAGCFDDPDYEGRICTALDPCPSGYICDADERCHRPCRDDEDCIAPATCGRTGRCETPVVVPPPVVPPPVDVCAGITCDVAPNECYEPIGRCDPADGSCIFDLKPASTSCDDGNACTSGDFCDLGDCRSGAMLDCDDREACTDDACDPAMGCDHKDNSMGCDDGDACTAGDVCGGGVCRAGVARSCDDGNPCTTDGCDALTGCRSSPVTDGMACTFAGGGAGQCSAGACVGCVVDGDCDDGNVCTDDSCLLSACMHVENVAACDDGDICTFGDRCAAGRCAGTAITCASNACVTRSCNGTAACDEQFHSGAACADDGNACTRDVCNASGGCTHPALANGASCGANASSRCCGGSCVNIAANTSHCGGCGSACAAGLACESVSVTTMCADHPANVTGRCRCNGSNAQCPRGQVCRTQTPYADRCAPAAVSACAAGQIHVSENSCPDFCRY